MSKQFNVELPDETYFLIEQEHKKTGISKKRLAQNAIERIFGRSV